MLSKHEHHYGLGMDALVTVCSRNANVIIVWAWMPERSPAALSCPATKHCEYGHKMASGSLASARNPTPVSKIELLQRLKTARLHQAGGKNQLDQGFAKRVDLMIAAGLSAAYFGGSGLQVCELRCVTLSTSCPGNYGAMVY